MEKSKLKLVLDKIKQLLAYSEVGLIAFRDLIKHFTPKWFILLEWLVILGFLKYIALLTNDGIVKFLYNFSFILLLFYLLEIVQTSPLNKIPKTISFILSLSTGLFIYLLTKNLERFILLLH